jgi:tRNA-splicing ligase RtcB (3'-phosphate/5'-hydroxy nucleic acid ligase)
VVLATPDLHTGYGVPIGSVFASPSYVSPAAVGYDINCGMRLLTTPLRADEADVVTLASSIRRDIPLGEGQSNLAVSPRSLGQLLEGGVPALVEVARREVALERAVSEEELARDARHIEDGGVMHAEKRAVPDRAISRGASQLATLGGGNHFIELQRVDRVDDPATARDFGLFVGQLVVMLHSGSRGLGHEIGGHYMRKASEVCRASRSSFRRETSPTCRSIRPRVEPTSRRWPPPRTTRS